MSDNIKHECGIALLRLLKPLEYYQEKYGSAFYGINKMYLLMEKQHNRGQDGAGIACVKIDTQPGHQYIYRERSVDAQPIKDIFKTINQPINKAIEKDKNILNNTEWVKNNIPFAAELFLGHLRYGTFGKNDIENCHPFIRENNWKTRNLVVAGNFNLTNVDELFNKLVQIGQHPRKYADTVTILEKIGHFLDKENEELYKLLKHQEGISKKDASIHIANRLDIKSILKKSVKRWDGGYVIGGMIGHGDAFVLRDPNGIRPAFYYQDDEVVVVASERPVIQTAFNLKISEIKELTPGAALIIKKKGQVTEEKLHKKERKILQCSFERIYFSRGSDADIYKERKQLGRLLVKDVLKAIDNDIDNTVFSFIPNTAETAFYGMVKELEQWINKIKLQEIKALGQNINEDQLTKILAKRARVEKIAIKDAKLRTFITDDSQRNEMVTHVYDVTYGIVNSQKDNLVVIDDSIVRGTTLKESIIRILDRLEPKKIVIVSSAPQVRYPDCYGIDMAKLGDFIAFQAAITLLKENKLTAILEEAYQKAKEQMLLPKEEMVNCVKMIYEPFTDEQISNKIAELLKPHDTKAEIAIVYQSIDNLHKACPNHLGDWYFSGNYPTPGGNKVANQSLINFYEGKNQRAY